MFIDSLRDIILRRYLEIFILITAFYFLSVSEVNANNIYKMDLIVDSSRRVINGNMKVSIKNESRENLDTVYFLMGLNRNYDTSMKIIEVSDDNDLILPGSYYSYRYLGEEKKDKSIYQVNLHETMVSGGSINLNLKFELSNLTKINNIIFLDDSVNDYYSASWYPRAINYQRGAWHINDFYVNDYELNITVPENETVAGSGIELGTELMRGKGLKVISYKLNNARGFSLAISPDISPQIEDTKEGVIIKTYYKNNKFNKWSQLITETASDIISFYKSKFGFYPYRQLNIIPGNNFSPGGQANNNLIILHETFENNKTKEEIGSQLKWELSNYIGQQYFSYYIGESGEYPKWISNGAAFYMSSVYLKEHNLKTDQFSDLLDQYLRAARAGFNTQVLQKTEQLRESNFAWQNVIEKGKAAQIFKMLEYSIGRKALQDTLKESLEKYKHQVIYTDTFQSMAENISAKSLSWFFSQWVSEDKRLDYAVTKIKQNKIGDKYQVSISVKRIGKISMPVSIAITLKDNSRVFQVWDGNTNEAELTYEYKSPVKSVHIDPAGTLPDIDRSNNLVNAN